MDLHVILTIGEYAFRRIATGWFIRLLGAFSVILIGILLQEGPEPIDALLEARSLALDAIGLASILLVTVMGATEIPRDIESRTILIILSKPLTKADIVLGKFLGLIYVAGFTILMLGATTLVGIALQGHLQGISLPPDANFFQKCGFAFLKAILIAAVVVLLSTRLSEIPIIFFTGFYTVLAYVIIFMQALLVRSGLPTAAAIVLWGIYYCIPSFQYLEVAPEVTLKGSVGWDHFLFAALYTVLYSTIFMILALRSFDRREVAG